MEREIPVNIRKPLADSDETLPSQKKKKKKNKGMVGNHETGLSGWTCSLFVFFLPQYTHRSTPMYWALFYESQNFTLFIYMYIYIYRKSMY